MLTPFERLHEFLSEKMRMSQIYQPAMLRVLLESPEGASRRAIAEAFLAYDEPQKEYYQEILKRWPWKTLKKHGLVERHGDQYKLPASLLDLSDSEREQLVRLAEAKITEFLASRKVDPFDHRRKNTSAIPGSLRYDVLARAKGRCEACGISSAERRLDVDHIVPRNKGGSNEIDNLQALCFVCNSQKRDRDATAFRDWNDAGGNADAECPFCNPVSERCVDEQASVRVLLDLYPVTEGHHLIVPKRHVDSWFDLSPGEQNAITAVVQRLQRELKERDKTIGGFNIGVNSGTVAGQTVPHAHMHLIPRRKGDTADPTGGVRGVIPSKQRYR